MTPQEQLNIALSHQEAGRLDQAEEIYRSILSLDPANAAVLNNLADLLKDSGRIDEAVDHCRRALQIDPLNAQIHSSLCYKLHFHPGYDQAAIFQEMRQWDSRHKRDVMAFPPDSPDRRLRVGYVSPDFYGHAECFFVFPLLDGHDRRNVEVHCYSSVRRPDKATEILKTRADVWHDVAELSDEELAERIREDQIDILVDLTMHMAFNRLPMFALKPAPIQVTWLAYPGGTGLSAMDYRLTDGWIDPPGQDDQYYSEESIRLPDAWCCYHPLGEVPPAARRDDGPVMFGSLNYPYKLNEPTLLLWAKVLLRVRGSRLLLLVKSENQRDKISETFANAAVDPMRIEFTGPVRRGEYLRNYDRIDICLDPLPYNGITTTCDALWMGVPVITRVGRTAPGRAGSSLLSNLQLPELIAHDDDQFITLADELAANFTKRSQLRASLRDRMRKSPLMDGRRFAKNVETAYRQMWLRLCV